MLEHATKPIFSYELIGVDENDSTCIVYVEAESDAQALRRIHDFMRMIHLGDQAIKFYVVAKAKAEG